MCGVCASTAPHSHLAHDAVKMLNEAQQHRGPDGAITSSHGRTCLGNTRLAIIRPDSDGDQPFTDPGGACTVVFNGEIYNYRELVRDHRLDPLGSDGGVVPQLFARLGTAAFGLLRGMYAIVLLDHASGRLLLARDPLGIKPLHWRVDGDTLLVSSEVRPLLEPADDLPPAAVARFLHLGALGPAMSPVEQVRAVPPNTWLAFDGVACVDGGAVEAGLDLSRGSSQPLRQALVESVSLHLRSDVPTALLLSSGVDSSAIAWAAREAGQTLHCLTVDLGGGREEARAAGATAALYGHAHDLVQRAPEDDDVPAFFRAMQRPTVDGLNTFVVCRAVRAAGYKVALSGLGGDEATAGYSHFKRLPHLPRLAHIDRHPLLSSVRDATVRALAGQLSAKARQLLSSGGPRTAWGLSLLQRQVWPAELVHAAVPLAGDDLIQQPPPLGNGSRAAALVEAEYLTYLQSTLLPDADAFSMASSVELRVPLVDRPFLAAAVGGGGSRGLGKRGFAEALGQQHLARLADAPKQGFSLPMDRWLRGGVLRQSLEDAKMPAAPVWNHVKREVGLEVLDRWTRGELPWSHAWALVVLDQWLRHLPRASL